MRKIQGSINVRDADIDFGVRGRGKVTYSNYSQEIFKFEMAKLSDLVHKEVKQRQPMHYTYSIYAVN